MEQTRRSVLASHILVAVYFVMVLRAAWLCDDAYITFRTIDNFINGYGLRWNIAERVQAYTHPLWMLFLSAFSFVTHEFFYTPIFISIFVSVAAIWLLVRRLAVSFSSALLATAPLILSRAFVDYSTSGLENPLSYLLVVCCFIVYFSNSASSGRKLFLLSLCGGLLATNRMDLILIVVPSIAALWLERPSMRAIGLVTAGFVPFIAWEIFSLIYYGFPFPNTAYAKLNTGMSALDYIGPGSIYILNSLRWDPVTGFTILLAAISVAATRNKKMVPILAGIVLYLAYIVRIGGCFMSGRLLSVPLLCAAVCLARSGLQVRSAGYSFGLASYVLLTVAAALLSPFNDPDFKRNPVDPFNLIADERMYFMRDTGLMHVRKDSPPPYNVWADEGRGMKTRNEKVTVQGTVGMLGFLAGPDVHVIDAMGLGDPLLARLHVRKDFAWRPGHYVRELPAGYLESVYSKTNLIQDPNVARYYEKLTIVTRGDLFSIGRIKTIYAMNTGKYEKWLNAPDGMD